MKIWISAALIISIYIFGIYEASAQKSDGEKKASASDFEKLGKQLRIQVEWIELSHEDFTALMEEADSQKPKSSNDGPLREKLKEMIEEGDAEIIDTAVVMARSGQRAKVESVREVTYPTEYIPAGFVETDKTDKQEGSSQSEEAEKDEDQKSLLPTPSNFKVRNVGTTLEVDPVLGADERTIDLSLSPEIVYLAGHEEYGVYVEGDSEVVAVMPNFYTMKVTTQVSMIKGEYCFAGVQSPLETEDGVTDRERKVMVFLKADVLYVGLPVKGGK